MKSIRLALSLLFVSVCAFAEQADHWTYDPSAGTISDNEWTFAATVKSGTTDMTVGACSVWPLVASPLDFSKSVTDGDATSYDIVNFISIPYAQNRSGLNA